MKHVFQSLRGVLLAAGLAAALLPMAVNAAPVWQQSNDLTSTLDDNWTYTSDSATRTAVVSYTNQSATNTGSSTEHLGMYLGWAWSIDGTGANTPLLWDNTTQAFVGGLVSLNVTLPVVGTQSLLLSDIVGDTWVGNGWAPIGSGYTPIATQGAWDVPFFDFGDIAAGDSVNYDITLTFTFATQTAFDDWNSAGDFYIGGQGVAAIPEPGSFALAGLALLGLAIARRRRRV
jgi:hypothetical protein